MDLAADVTVLIRCVDLDANIAFFVDEIGFRIELVTPADDPRRFVIQRDCCRLALVRAERDEPIEIEVSATGEPTGVRRAPNGSTVQTTARASTIDIPESVPSLTVVRADDGEFGAGRAGMGYRDLLPDRWGGRFIASHITIDDGGDVADWVHFHRIRFQMIFVAAGWVDVVYEDQGEPFRMHAGDCVLQPPEIRHRVLRSSPGLEVIEIGCPAEHDTLADHDLVLPNDTLAPDRDFDGQRFVRHVAADAEVADWLVDGSTVRDTGIGTATDGLAGAVVVTTDDAGDHSATLTHDGEFVLLVGLDGAATIDIENGSTVEMGPRTSIAIPPGTRWTSRTSGSAPSETLVVSLPAGAIRRA